MRSIPSGILEDGSLQALVLEKMIYAIDLYYCNGRDMHSILAKTRIRKPRLSMRKEGTRNSELGTRNN